jgi:NAD(P)-dependent dehydrogenase (short-subunit alcohol dehydrogenase family)
VAATPVALVTGAANNIGLATAHAFAADHLVIMADKLDLTSAAQDVGSQAIGLQGDVTSEYDCASWVAAAQRTGRLKAVVHAAAITMPALPVERISLEEWERVLRVNLTGSFVLSKAVLPALRQSAPASLVLLASRAGKTGNAALGINPGATKAHYAASKAGVISLTKSLALENAAYGVRVNCIAPGPIEGTMIPKAQWRTIARHVPLGRLGTAEEIAAAARFLCSEQASFITGHTLDVNGGSLVD